MNSFAERIEQAAEGEPIEAVVIGSFGWGRGDADEDAYGFDEKDRSPIPESMKRRPIEWAEARPMLDYDHDQGYGAPDCHAIAAYTKSRVLYACQYDGSTWVSSVMRNPGEFDPGMPGG